MKSIWKDQIDLPEFPVLEADRKTKVLIIGGGMAGILCAYFLHQAGVDYILTEGETICSGVTQNTTAKLTVQHGLIYDQLIKQYGIDLAQQYLNINGQAFLKYRSLCKNIDCDFEEKDSYVYSLNRPDIIRQEIQALGDLGCPTDFVSQLPLPMPIAGAVRMKNQAQFHPLKFIREISKGLHIYEHTFVSKIEDHVAITNRGKITADKIVVATHFPFLNRHGSYFIKMYQHRSYVIAYRQALNVDGMYVDESMTGMSFRNYEDYLLIGGGDHRTGKQGGNWEEIRSFAKRYFPDAVECYHWATQDCMTLDSVPYIGHYSKNMPDLYVATGFNKWGMTGAMASAMILSELVQNKKHAFSDVFNPSRSILRPQLFINGCEAMVNLLTISKRRCPHLGCALKWNKAEHTWDCPCHGSRFDQNGNLLENPATKNIHG